MLSLTGAGAAFGAGVLAAGFGSAGATGVGFGGGPLGTGGGNVLGSGCGRALGTDGPGLGCGFPGAPPGCACSPSDAQAVISPTEISSVRTLHAYHEARDGPGK